MVSLESESLTCISGTVNYEQETGVVTYDDSTEKTCAFGHAKCYKQTMDVVVGNWPITTVEGGCLHPFAEPLLKNQQVMESFFPQGSSVNSLNFDTCSGSNCFDLSSESK